MPWYVRYAGIVWLIPGEACGAFAGFVWPAPANSGPAALAGIVVGAALYFAFLFIWLRRQP